MTWGQSGFFGHFTDHHAVPEVVLNIPAGEYDLRAFEAVGHGPQGQSHSSQVFYKERQQLDGGVDFIRL